MSYYSLNLEYPHQVIDHQDAYVDRQYTLTVWRISRVSEARHGNDVERFLHIGPGIAGKRLICKAAVDFGRKADDKKEE
jgi:hypothetical protein